MLFLKNFIMGVTEDWYLLKNVMKNVLGKLLVLLGSDFVQ